MRDWVYYVLLGATALAGLASIGVWVVMLYAQAVYGGDPASAPEWAVFFLKMYQLMLIGFGAW